MLYVLIEGDYDSYEFKQVYEGPAGIDTHELREEFMSNFAYKHSGDPEYPKYDGPLIDNPHLKPGLLYSGSFSTDLQIPAPTCPELEAWLIACNDVRNKWAKEREDKIEEYRKKYSGNDLSEIFVSFMEIEYGFKKVDAVEM